MDVVTSCPPAESRASTPGAGPSAPLAGLLSLLGSDRQFVSMVDLRTATVAVPEAARPFVLAGLAHSSGRPTLVVAVATGAEAERLSGDLAAFLGPEEVELLPPWETLPFERVSPSASAMARRSRVFWRIRQARPPRVVVASVRALLQRLGPGARRSEPLVVRKGQVLDRDGLVLDLARLGYRREYQVEHHGEMAVRGSIVDVFCPTWENPVRIDFFGDEVERLKWFSVEDQLSLSEASVVEVHACRELRPDQALRARARQLLTEAPWGKAQWEKLADGQTFDGMEPLLPWLTDDELLFCDLLPSGSLVVALEPRRLKDRATDIIEEEAALAASLAVTWGAAGQEFPPLHLSWDRLLGSADCALWNLVSAPDSPSTPLLAAKGFEPGRLGGGLIEEVSGLLSQGWRVVLAANSPSSASRISQRCQEAGVVAPVVEDPVAQDLIAAGATVVVAPLEKGFSYPSLRLAVVSEQDLTGRRLAHRHPRPRRSASGVSFEDLVPGSFVVHYQHGVGRYAGMVRREMGGVERDYLLLEYKGGDKLYVPSDQVDLLRPYLGGESPALNRLGGSEWARAKSRVRAATRQIAQELVVLYQKRASTPGRAFGPDTPWQAEMEQAFPYTETPDQVRAIEEVKADMESSVPMDRLVCGDVGFGKTEIAIRAAFKAVQDGFQVAVLVPTTLLASQHHQTFAERFSGYPVRVESLSRFLTPAQAAEVVQGLADGSVDVVIGTHRLLSGDVKFKNLGLLVIDEEQRFGVTHKEAIKKLRLDVDALTLTATPIPRTLEMSLTGLRDLSLLRTPPAERQPILTYVGEYDERAVAEAIRRELLREGQVFFVHNRVADIDKVAAELRAMVPEARVSVAHGQMDEGSLEKVVLDFWEGRSDVLVCTTIIESGIDMPTVNTLVVDRADLLGLGQLHQLRGRVGRAGQRAYAYLFYPPDRSISEEAYERLRTIGENTELGSGFNSHAGPRDQGGGEPPGRGSIGSHRRRRLRPLRADGL